MNTSTEEQLIEKILADIKDGKCTWAQGVLKFRSLTNTSITYLVDIGLIAAAKKAAGVN